MIIKKEYKNKETGDIKTEYTSDKAGYKVVMVKGKPEERKMDQTEKANRDHGGGKEGNHGQQGGRGKQKGITKINKKAETKYREKKQTLSEEDIMPSKKIDIKKSLKERQKRIQELSKELEIAMLDQKKDEVDMKEEEILKREEYIKRKEKYLIKDKQLLKDKNSYYMDEASPEESSEDEDILSKITKAVKDGEKTPTDKTPSDEKKPSTSGNKDDVLSKITKAVGDNKGTGSEEDILDRLADKITKKMQDIPAEDPADSTDPADPAEDPADSTDPADPAEDPADSTDPADEEIEPSEIETIVDDNEYNLEDNNAYDFYDFMIEKLIDESSIKAFNSAYESIPEEKRNIVPAQRLYDDALELYTKDQEAKDLASTPAPDTGAEDLGGV